MLLFPIASNVSSSKNRDDHRSTYQAYARMTENLLRFTLAEPAGADRVAEPICFGFPIERGQISGRANLHLVDAEWGEAVVCSDVRCTSKWPDGSCRWLLVNAVVALQAYAEKSFAIAHVELQNDNCELKKNSTWDLKTKAICEVALNQGAVTVQHRDCSTDFRSNLRVYVKDLDGLSHDVSFSSLESVTTNAWFVNKQVCKGKVDLARHKTLDLTLSVTSYPVSLMTKVELLLHNPAFARHKHGLWDLGDLNSLEFKEIGVELDGQVLKVSNLRVEEEGVIDVKTFVSPESFRLTQYSSGGENDRSEAHVDKHGNIPFSRSGYELVVDDEVQLVGRRSQPTVVLKGSQGSTQLYPVDFWQTFPSELCAERDKVSFALYSGRDYSLHELQPGERTSKAFVLRSGSVNDNLGCRKPLELRGIAEGSVCVANSVLEHSLSPISDLDHRLLDYLCGPEVFLQKREIIDEYGWRNYGDVFADHESLYVERGGSPLISHYNNQYDLIMGFGLQYMRTYDARWLQLMDDLVKHLIEIDMYETSEDRVEYNHGLFWHTNHYEAAETATHRTFSIKNYNPNQPYGSSGGPGAEHCYTTGLALHYFLRGDERSADAVIGLAQWIDNHLNGDSCFLGRIHSIAKHELPRLIKIIRGQGVLPGRYPFTRGTGNYLRACLDAYVVSDNPEWLRKADNIVVETFSALDNIAHRDLQNIEGTWFHTIFLQEVVRYFIVKTELDMQDAAYFHAKSAFLHYAHWMLNTAVPYLSRPELLEFVNDTWAAQDIRRYLLLKSAAKMDTKQSPEFERKAQEFADHIISQVGSSDTYHFARIQAIQLQNLCKGSDELEAGEQVHIDCVDIEQRASVLIELKRLWMKLREGVTKFSIRDEIRWLRTRV